MLTLLIQIYVYSFILLIVLTTAAATFWGGWTERLVAWLFVAAFASTRLLKSSAYGSLETGILIVDGTLLVVLAAITIRTGKGWLIWATAFQLIATLGHLGKLLNPELSRMGYSLMETASSHPTQIALAIGIYLHRRRMTGGGAGTSSATY